VNANETVLAVSARLASRRLLSLLYWYLNLNGGSSARYCPFLQLLNLNEAMCVCQLMLDVVW
jgi:hypothetical protein